MATNDFTTDPAITPGKHSQAALIATMPDDFPHIPCVVEPRCKLCQLKVHDPQLFDWVNRSLFAGVTHADIIAHCAQAGVKTSPQSLCKHKSDHLMDFVRDAIRTHLELSVISQQIGSVQDGNVAVIITRLLSIMILPLLNGVRDNLQDLARTEPERAVRLALDIAKTASTVQTADATTRLRALELQDRLLRYDAAKRARMQLAVDQMREEFRTKAPDIWARIEPALLEFLELEETTDAPSPGGEAT